MLHIYKVQWVSKRQSVQARKVRQQNAREYDTKQPRRRWWWCCVIIFRPRGSHTTNAASQSLADEFCCGDKMRRAASTSSKASTRQTTPMLLLRAADFLCEAICYAGLFVCLCVWTKLYVKPSLDRVHVAFLPYPIVFHL